MKVRNSNIEILRVIFMFLILVNHVYGHGSGLNLKWIYSLGSEWDTAWNLALDSLCKLGVTGFIFISGYFGIRTTKKSLAHILLIPFFYTLILSIAFKHLGFHEIINLIFAFNGWWFVSCYVFIMLLSPFIEEGIKKIKGRIFLIIVMGMLVYTYVMNSLGKADSHDIILLLTVYMTARYLKLYPQSCIASKMRMGGVYAFVLIALIPVAIEQIGWNTDKLMPYVFQNNNILLLIADYWIIYNCDKHAIYNRYINKIAAGSLAIYLVTDYPDVRDFLDPMLLPYVLKGYGLIIIVGLCVGILIIDMVRAWIFRLEIWNTIVNNIESCVRQKQDRHQSQ